MSEVGNVYLVGAGCGDFDLITLRGMCLIQKCDVLVYDSLIDDRLLDFAPENAEKISVGKRAGCHSATQQDINNMLVKYALEGKNVVRLKGGDPFVFGRGGEEIVALREHNIPYSAVPGISSSIAVPELAGIPVTHRRVSRSFHIITGHTAEDMLPDDMRAYAQLDGTLIFLMGLKNLEIIAESLLENGKPDTTPAAVISNGVAVGSKIVRGNLKNIAGIVKISGIASPAIIVIGETAGYDFSSTINLPLNGKSVAVTGTRGFAQKLEVSLIALGADVRRAEHLRVCEYVDNSDFDNALKNIQSYSVIVLTSINGVRIFFDRLHSLKADIRKLSNIRFAVIGSGTADALEKHGIFADLLPGKYTSAALGRLLVREVDSKEKILILRAERGSPELTKILSDAEMDFEDIKTYDVISDGNNDNDKTVKTDFITFASSSGVNAFFDNGYKISPETRIVCIGDITADALKKYGVSDYVISKTSNVDGITETILQEVQNEKI